jgi:hypothetical protein
MYILSRAEKEQQEMRVVKESPATDWKGVWPDLHDACIAKTITAVWYVTILEIIPTNVILHKIRLAETPKCKECGGLDTRLYRLIE